MSLDETEEFSDLVGSIYDAAMDSALWLTALERVADYVGGKSAALFYRDLVKRQGEVYYQYNIADEFKVSYFEKYIKLDPTLIGYNMAPVCEPISTVQVMPYSEFIESRFYKEWAVPQGFVDSVGVVLERTTTTSAIVGVMRTNAEGLADEKAFTRIRLAAPHLKRAVTIGNLLNWSNSKADSLADAFDGLQADFFLVDANARLLHVNANGAATLERRHILRLFGGRLQAVNAEADTQLGKIFAAHGKGAAVGLLAPDGARYVAHVLPLTDSARRKAGLGYDAVAAVFVTKVSVDTPTQPGLIAHDFSLTPSELRVLLAVVEIGSVARAADALGVAETTAKFHLSSVFAKTGTRQQTELVKLVAGYASPLTSQ